MAETVVFDNLAELAKKHPGSKTAQLMAKDEAEEDVRDSRRMDPEILCLSRIARMLEELDTEAKARVIGYLSKRYSQGY